MKKIGTEKHKRILKKKRDFTKAYHCISNFNNIWKEHWGSKTI